VRPIQLLVRLPRSDIDPDWLRDAERESRNPLRESESAANHILRGTGSLPQVGLCESIAETPGLMNRFPDVMQAFRGKMRIFLMAAGSKMKYFRHIYAPPAMLNHRNLRHADLAYA
jgi:hypothetical protein